jgi:V/A-type H+-transporting ATPase subunit C
LTIVNDQLQDIDYLYASARIRGMERTLLSRPRFIRMSEAKSVSEALKVLTESGWDEIEAETVAQVEVALAVERQRTVNDLMEIAPDKRVVSVFLLKYDYHNIKTYLKGEAGDSGNYDELYIDTGTVPLKKLTPILREKTYLFLTSQMKNAVTDASELLARTSDAQLMDILLDKACYQEMLYLAQEADIDFLVDYVRLAIDSANLRAAVRMRKTGRNMEYMRQAYIPGGHLNTDALVAEITPELLDNLFGGGPLAEAAQVAGAILRGGETMSKLDLEADNALTRYVKGGKYVAFGPEALIGYMVARETELTTIRVIIAGIVAGLPTESITERLRDAYV